MSKRANGEQLAASVSASSSRVQSSSSTTTMTTTTRITGSSTASLNGVTIAVMGATGTGKSTFINLASDSNLVVSDSLKSCTTHVGLSKTFSVDDVPVTLVDTPGFDDTSVSDTDILRRIASYLTTSYEKGYKLSGLIYIHRISDIRMGGVARKNYMMFRKLCGDPTLKNVVITTNMWGEVTAAEGAKRELQLKTDDLLFKPVLDAGARMVRHDGTKDNAVAIIRSIIRNDPKALQIQKEIVEERKTIEQTEAVHMLDEQMREMREQYEKKIKDIKDDMQAALDRRDSKTKNELQRAKDELENRLAQAETRRNNLTVEFQKEQQESSQVIEELKRRVAEEQRLAALKKETAEAQFQNERVARSHLEDVIQQQREALRIKEENLRTQQDLVRRQQAIMERDVRTVNVQALEERLALARRDNDQSLVEILSAFSTLERRVEWYQIKYEGKTVGKVGPLYKHGEAAVAALGKATDERGLEARWDDQRDEDWNQYQDVHRDHERKLALLKRYIEDNRNQLEPLAAQAEDRLKQREAGQKYQAFVDMVGVLGVRGIL